MMKHIKLLMQIPPVFTDGFLCMVAALCAAVLTYLSTEEAYKYNNPVLLFWLKIALGSSLAGINALVGFRSKTYSQHLLQVKANETGVSQTQTTDPVIKKEETK